MVGTLLTEWRVTCVTLVFELVACYCLLLHPASRPLLHQHCVQATGPALSRSCSSCSAIRTARKQRVLPFHQQSQDNRSAFYIYVEHRVVNRLPRKYICCAVAIAQEHTSIGMRPIVPVIKAHTAFRTNTPHSLYSPSCALGRVIHPSGATLNTHSLVPQYWICY